jgi:hypothetical protein
VTRADVPPGARDRPESNVLNAGAPMPDSQKSETAVVYHYTDVDTMMKIVDSACLWATSIKYLKSTSISGI